MLEVKKDLYLEYKKDDFFLKDTSAISWSENKSLLKRFIARFTRKRFFVLFECDQCGWQKEFCCHAYVNIDKLLRRHIKCWKCKGE